MLGALDRKHEADFDHTHVWVGGIPEVSQTLLLTEVRARCISQSRSGTESTPGSRWALSRWRAPPAVTWLVERALCFASPAPGAFPLATALQVPTGNAPLSSSQSCGSHSADLPPLLWLQAVRARGSVLPESLAHSHRDPRPKLHQWESIQRFCEKFQGEKLSVSWGR